MRFLFSPLLLGIFFLAAFTDSIFLKKSQKSQKSCLQNPQIPVNSYYFQPKTNSSVYLAAGDYFIFRNYPPFGLKVVITVSPTLVYANLKEGLIRNYLNGTILKNFTLNGAMTRPTIILLFNTPEGQNDPELINPTWKFIKRDGAKIYSITKQIINPISFKEEVWAFTFFDNNLVQNVEFALYDPKLDTQKWKIY